MSASTKKIALGYPLDLLLNRNCKFDKYQYCINNDFIEIHPDKEDNWGSIILPDSKGDPGTGNIIIRGKPGTAKSTLAMQFAVSAAQRNNDCISFYITLEEQPENILFKTKPFGWDPYCSIFNQLCGIDESATVDDYSKYLEKAMTQDDKICRFHNKNKESEPCKKHEKNRIEPHVFISTLTPRNLFASDSKEFNLFWDRYNQLERLLAAAHAYNNSKCVKFQIRFVVIDSINVFGDNLLSRSELFRLFDLFKKYQIIGIIVVEEDEKYIFQQDNKLHGETLEYIGDVIISLTAEDDQGYALRYFEITKSRYQHQVYGKHPFKIMESAFTKQLQKDFFNKIMKGDVLFLPAGFIHGQAIIPGEYNVQIKNIKLRPVSEDINNYEIYEEEKNEGYLLLEINHLNAVNYSIKRYETSPSETKTLDSLIISLPQPVFAVKVFPSLHYIVYGTDIGEPDTLNQDSKLDKDAFCDEYANIFLSKIPIKTKSLLIEGPRDTFKTSLARDFLMKGLFENDNAHVLFIRFLDYYTEGDTLKAFRISEKCGKIISSEPKFGKFAHDNVDRTKKFWKNNESNWNGLKLEDGEPIKSTKRFLCSYECVIDNQGISQSKRFTELIYQSGYLSPEEFIQILLETIHKFDPEQLHRIVLDEIGRIGSSYPLLYRSKTAGDLFLTAVFHIIRNYKIRLLVTGTTGEYSKADEIINKAKTLVDDILTTKKINVFGDNYVTIQGGTLTSSEFSHEQKHPDEKKRSDENVPGVIIPTGKYIFRVDSKKFVGLVGFDIGQVKRPVLNFHTFQEMELHRNYNNSIKKMLFYAFGNSDENSHAITGEIDPVRKSSIDVEDSKTRDIKAMLGSLDILKDKPINSTIVSTVDEFYLNQIKDNVLEGMLRKSEDELKRTIEDGKYAELDRSDNKWKNVKVFKKKKYLSLMKKSFNNELKREDSYLRTNIEKKFARFYSQDKLKKVEKPEEDEIPKEGELPKEDLKPKRLKVYNKEFFKENIFPYYANVLLVVFRNKDFDNCGLFEKIDSYEKKAKQLKFKTDKLSLTKKDFSDLIPSKKVKYPKANRWEQILDLAEKINCALSERQKLKIVEFAEKTKKTLEGINEENYYDKISEIEDEINKEYMLAFDKLLLVKKIKSLIKKSNNTNFSDTTNRIKEHINLAIKGKSGYIRKYTHFEYFRYSYETLTSMFLDALISGSGNNKGKKENFNILCIDDKNIRGQQRTELNSLRKLLLYAEEFRKTKPVYDPPEDEKKEISTNAAVYLCWYTQWRELIHDNPDMVDKYTVCALPAGGVRGDWFLGVAKGSVSISLGKQMIKLLTSEKEEYNRWIYGIGLPTFERLYDCYSIWPGSKEPLSILKTIHKNAFSRKEIIGYSNFYYLLYTKCMQLCKYPKETVDIDDKFIDEMFNELKKIDPCLEQIYTLQKTDS